MIKGSAQTETVQCGKQAKTCGMSKAENMAPTRSGTIAAPGTGVGQQETKTMEL